MTPRRIPIALFLPTFYPGGTERQMIELIRRLDPTRFEVHLACTERGGPWFERAAEAAVSVADFPIRGFLKPDTLRQAWAFGRWCRRQRIALVHTCELYSNIFGLPAAAAAGVPVRIGSRREIAAGKSAAQIALQRSAYACAHRVIANAQAAADRLRLERVPATRIDVVPNGLDLARFATRNTRHFQGRIVMVANLRPEKGHDTLIDAAVVLLARYPRLTFDIVGDGTERERMVQYANARGVAHAFTFSGHSEDVAARLAAADIFVLPSRTEAFPNAVLEAMAAGLPVVASAVGGILEVVEHNVTGLLVAPGRSETLAQALGRLIDDAPLRTRLATAGRALVVSRYSFDRMVAAVEAVYLSELAARVRPTARAQWAAL